MRPRYIPEELQAIEELLARSATFEFPALEGGLFRAVPASAARGGYEHVWVRDNVHIAHAHLVTGDETAAARCVRALARFFASSERRFRGIVDGTASPDDPMNRPHVRFDGTRSEEVAESWAHAQNDALGYFVWIFCRMLATGVLPPMEGDAALIGLFVEYFQAIRYWEDEDSGHWEETRKVSASSIGTVVAGLDEVERLLGCSDDRARLGDDSGPPLELVRRLARRGRDALERILPSECVQGEPGKRRRNDAALLFLVEPLGVVSRETASTIVEETLTSLQGSHGIRRYLGDSYWAPDYERHVEKERRSSDHSETLDWRDRLARPGGEAQWCLFDPVVSTFFGKRYQRSGDPEDLRRQTRHFNRALGQLTGEGSRRGALRCPEAYYLRAGRYVPNDQTPLLWTQANLLVALKTMRASARLASSRP